MILCSYVINRLIQNTSVETKIKNKRMIVPLIYCESINWTLAMRYEQKQAQLHKSRYDVGRSLVQQGLTASVTVFEGFLSCSVSYKKAESHFGLFIYLFLAS